LGSIHPDAVPNAGHEKAEAINRPASRRKKVGEDTNGIREDATGLNGKLDLIRVPIIIPIESY
jgi:hypothetical protein